jgi:hypothetical protein
MFKMMLPLFFLVCAVPLMGEPIDKPSAQKLEAFKPFTGKIVASKVRLRAKPDLDSHIVRQMNKGELVLVVEDVQDFWAIQPPLGTKAYVFRSYVLDNVVEANHVNVRLEPHVDAPILTQLQAGEKVEGAVCAMNQKWLEINPPARARFYISKEFVSHAGGPDYFTSMEKRKSAVEALLHSALFLAETECAKPYEEISLHAPLEQLQTLIRSYTDFPEAVERAKEGLALLKETYLQKKIEYLEARAELTPAEKESLLSKHREECRELSALRTKATALSDRAQFWNTIEESLYLSWTAFHTEKSMADFYQEQKANGLLLTGIIERYDQNVKNKPGDYVLRGIHAPIGYLYSTQVDLEKYQGKKVTLQVSPRSNNHFAFPAYFVLSEPRLVAE